MKAFGRIDALIVNHAILQPMKRISQGTIEDWKKLYDVNFFSALALVSCVQLARACAMPLTISRCNQRFRTCERHRVTSFSPAQARPSTRMHRGLRTVPPKLR